MSDEKETEEQQKIYPERWSAITPNDLGLQAAYWNGKDDDPVTFRQIVGWITYSLDEVPNPSEKKSRNGFAAIVIADHWYPALAGSVPDYAGTVPKGLSSAEVLPRLKSWKGKPEASQDQVNVLGVGRA